MNALRIAWREIRWEIFGDRGSLFRMLFFTILPITFVISNRSSNPTTLFTLALQSALFPALSGVALIASTFTQEKENGTIIPLLASPVRDMDIVVGKLLGMIIPVFAICCGSVGLYYFLASQQHGVTRVAAALPPSLLYAIVVVALLYLLTAGSWVLIVAALVRTSRAGQQLAGLLIGVSIAIFTTLGFLSSRFADGWPLVILGGILVLSDAIALEIARRVWRREEVLARI